MECLVGAVIWIVCIAVGMAICQERGRSTLDGLLLGLLLGPIGVIICVVLPTDVNALEKTALRSGEMRKCPYCAEPVRPQATVCRYCGRDIPIAPLQKVLYTGDGLVVQKCRNCGKTYDLAQVERCPFCEWTEPGRKKVLDTYRKQASGGSA